MTAINRIRPIASEKPLARAYCVSVFLPQPYANNVYKKDQRCNIGRPRLGVSSEEQIRHIRECGPVAAAVNAILDVPGVTVVRIFDYELQVTIAAAYDWSDCHQAIITAIKTHLFPGVDSVDVQDVRTTSGRPVYSDPPPAPAKDV